MDANNVIMTAGFAQENMGVSYESGSGEYAEWLKRANNDETLRPGEIVGVIGGQITKSTKNADKFMVISTSPAFLGNMPEAGETEKGMEKVAFMGQVPVRVAGDVEIGDFILPSGNDDGIGIAVSSEEMKALDYARIVGVAWEKSEPKKFVHSINTAVGINQNSTATMMNKMQNTLNTIQEYLAQQDPNFPLALYDTKQNGLANFSTSRTKGYSKAAYHKERLMTIASENKSSFNEGIVEEAFAIVKQTIGVDVQKDYPMIAMIAKHPEHSDMLVSHFTSGANMIQSILDETSKADK